MSAAIKDLVGEEEADNQEKRQEEEEFTSDNFHQYNTLPPFAGFHLKTAMLHNVVVNFPIRKFHQTVVSLFEKLLREMVQKRIDVVYFDVLGLPLMCLTVNRVLPQHKTYAFEF